MKKYVVFFALLCLLALPFGGLAEQYVLLKGDLHCHSSFSHDSDVPYGQVIEDSIIAGYDFIALTEHNTMRHLKEDLSAEGLLVIAGYEYTLRGGHYNLFGVRDFKVTTNVNRAELHDAIAALHGLGALVQLDHPNDANYPTRYGYEMDFDLLEVINGRVTEDDLQTLKDYQALLAEGRKVVATGGTDAHRNHRSRTVYTHVYAKERSEVAIVEALGAGRVFVTTGAEGPVVSLTCGEVFMGGTAVYEEGQKVTAQLDALEPGSLIRVYTEKGLLVERTCEVASYTEAFDTEGCAFLRVEVWRDQDTPILVSNPIYIVDRANA